MKHIAEEYGTAVLYVLTGLLIFNCLGRILAAVSAF